MLSQTAPRGARLRACALTFALALAGGLSAPAGAFAAAGGAGTSALDPEERAFCQHINAYRAAKGLAPLKLSPALTRAASWMTADMARNDYVDHTDSRGRDTPARIRAFGFRSAITGENLAAGMANAAATLEQWKADAAHRRGMLRANFKVIGIARSYGGGTMFGWHWATTFGGGRERGVAC